MRTLLCIGLLGALTLGCVPEAPPFDPTKPHRYRVLRGDTWQSVGSKRDCEPEELRAWNGLRDNHVLIPGQVLWIYPGGVGAPDREERPAVADADPPEEAGDGDEAQAAAAGSPRLRSAPSPGPGGTQKVDTPRLGPGGTALLSLLDEVDRPSDLQAIRSVRPRPEPTGGALAGRRGGLGGGGEVDGTEVAIDRVVKPEPGGPTGGAKVPQLPKAEPKRCLAARLDQDVGDYGMASASGLSRSQIKTGMRPVLLAIQGCIDGGGGGPHELHLEVSLGCDGLVYQTAIPKDAGLPRPILACVEAVAQQASFPAAAGATTFLYPVALGY